jgi:hypothetical protein
MGFVCHIPVAVLSSKSTLVSLCPRLHSRQDYVYAGCNGNDVVNRENKKIIP